MIQNGSPVLLFVVETRSGVKLLSRKAECLTWLLHLMWRVIPAPDAGHRCGNFTLTRGLRATLMLSHIIMHAKFMITGTQGRQQKQTQRGLMETLLIWRAPKWKPFKLGQTWLGLFSVWAWSSHKMFPISNKHPAANPIWPLSKRKQSNLLPPPTHF